AFTGRRGRTSRPTAPAGMRRRPPSLTLGSCSRRRKRQTVLSETPSFRAASAGVSHRTAIESIPINPVKLDQATCLARDVDREGRIELRQHAALVACMVGAQDEDAELELVAVCGQALHVEPAI